MAKPKRVPKAYQVEPIQLREVIWTAGVITPLQLCRIVAWKSAIAVAQVTTASEDQIRNATGEALERLSPFRDAQAPELSEDFWVRTYDAVGRPNKTGLRSLRGIQLPVASAVLAILNPNAWPVIDWRALQALFTDAPKDAARWWKYYRVYLQRLDELRKLADDGRSIHRVDQDAYLSTFEEGESPFDRISLKAAVESDSRAGAG